jgi:nucleoid DNA-binding protein
MHRAASKEMIKRLSDEFHLPVETISIIVNSQFRFVAETITSANPITGEYKNVYIRNFGRFVVTRLKRKKISDYSAVVDDNIQVIDDLKGEDNSNGSTVNDGRQQIASVPICPDNNRV